MAEYKILLLACDSQSTRISYNRLHASVGISQVIIEQKVSLKKVLKRKLKKHGWINTMGQIAFQIVMQRILSILSRKRIEDILQQNDLSTNPIPEEKVIRLNSVNDASTIKHILQIQPDLIIVNGTRIISKKLIEAAPCPLINMHAGITPEYRGVHGGYWAIWNKDPEHCGVTVHFVDAGVDTGNIIGQKIVEVSEKDNFITYPLLQQAAGLGLMETAIRNFKEHNLKVIHKENVHSRQWYHPTIWGYLLSRIFKKVK